ncbi:Hypothetical predicted protein [Octopus vulgaris]|uniref:PiggyBac transposable element-derived protein domain-containing protein n=1 Tax=Octopus vulgaris TaxID=6645 RepID=A0AA36AJ33_OCTVU|nr:Hypothetical predicted protein [Octopus vulgaris]
MQIYAGKDPVKGRETNQSSRVVEDLVKELENNDRNITCDNCFTRLVLARKLLSKKTTLVGTTRKNRVEFLSAFTNEKERKVNSTIFGFQKDSMILSYDLKKNYVVTLMSTMYSQPSVDSKGAEKKPEVITCYNKTKGGVDDSKVAYGYILQHD